MCSTINKKEIYLCSLKICFFKLKFSENELQIRRCQLDDTGPQPFSKVASGLQICANLQKNGPHITHLKFAKLRPLRNMQMSDGHLLIQITATNIKSRQTFSKFIKNYLLFEGVQCQAQQHLEHQPLETKIEFYVLGILDVHELLRCTVK